MLYEVHEVASFSPYPKAPVPSPSSLCADPGFSTLRPSDLVNKVDMQFSYFQRFGEEICCCCSFQFVLLLFAC